MILCDALLVCCIIPLFIYRLNWSSWTALYFVIIKNIVDSIPFLLLLLGATGLSRSTRSRVERGDRGLYGWQRSCSRSCWVPCPTRSDSWLYWYNFTIGIPPYRQVLLNPQGTRRHRVHTHLKYKILRTDIFFLFLTNTSEMLDVLLLYQYSCGHRILLWVSNPSKILNFEYCFPLVKD